MSDALGIVAIFMIVGSWVGAVVLVVAVLLDGDAHLALGFSCLSAGLGFSFYGAGLAVTASRDLARRSDEAKRDGRLPVTVDLLERYDWAVRHLIISGILLALGAAALAGR